LTLLTLPLRLVLEHSRGGFTSFETLELVRSLTEFNFIGFDLVEVLPPYDPTQITSLLAATLVHEFASLIALQEKSSETSTSEVITAD
jgi:agmatinase